MNNIDANGMNNESQQALILELETRIKAQDAIIRELRQLRERQWAIQDEHLTLIKKLRGGEQKDL